MNHRVIAVAGRTGLEPQSTGQCSGFLRTVSVLKACMHRMPVHGSGPEYQCSGTVRIPNWASVFWACLNRASVFWACTHRLSMFWGCTNRAPVLSPCMHRVSVFWACMAECQGSGPVHIACQCSHTDTARSISVPLWFRKKQLQQ